MLRENNKEIRRMTIKDDEEFLRQISTEVDLENDNYLKWIEDLKDFCIKNVLYALAPVQIGIPKRMMYLRNTSSDMTKNKDSNYDESIVLINPVIIKAKGHTRFTERCASCLDYTAIVDRPYSVEVEYSDINNNRYHDVFEGFKATLFCHEFDHLNGVLHIDLCSDIVKMTWDEAREYREKHPYEIISKEGEYDFNSHKFIGE